MYEYIARTADFFLTDLWKARAVAPTVGCLTRETRGSEKMIGEILSRKWGDLRPGLVGKADLRIKTRAFYPGSRLSKLPSPICQVALKCLGKEIMPSSVSSTLI